MRKDIEFKNKFLILPTSSSFNSKKLFNRLQASKCKGKVIVMHDGENDNGYIIERQAVEKAIPSLYNVPVVGKWKQYSNGDWGFGSHEQVLKFTSSSIEYYKDTIAYGIVPESCNHKWENILELDGITSHNYLTCECFLWNDKYPEQIKYVLNNGTNQSMEIFIIDGYWNDDNYLVITEFEFSALCILNKSEIAENNVEPCFPSAGISALSFKKNGSEPKLNEQNKLDYDSLKVEFDALEVKYNDLNLKFDTLTTDYNTLKSDFDNKEIENNNNKQALQEITHATKETLCSNYLEKGLITSDNSDYISLLTKIDDFSLEDFENKLKLISFDILSVQPKIEVQKLFSKEKSVNNGEQGTSSEYDLM